MKRLTDKRGLTLIEIVVSVAIIAVLAAIVIGTAIQVETKSKEQLMESTFALINAALAEFKDYGFKYDPRPYGGASGEREFYLSLDFPVDCNDYIVSRLESELVAACGGTTIFITPVTHEYEYSGCEAMYFMLRRVPKCRQILNKIDYSLITNTDPNSSKMEIEIDNEKYPFDRIIDPWGRTLQYDYYDENLPFTLNQRKKSKRTFPVVISAGADGRFGTTDDMKSRKR